MLRLLTVLCLGRAILAFLPVVTHVHRSFASTFLLAVEFKNPFEISKRDSLLLPYTTVDVDDFRESAFRIAWSFQPDPFNPYPPLSNCHFQTISGVYLRNDKDCRYVTPGQANKRLALKKAAMLAATLASEPDRHGTFWDHRQRITTPDSDFFHVDYRYHSDSGIPSSKGIVVIVHGLQSNSNSSLSVDMGRAYHKRGFDVACINFRGCSGVPNAGLRAYHLGFTDDLKQYLSLLKSGFQNPPPVFLSGFSLGANVVLKALGELGCAAYDDFNVYGAAVCGAPFENERNVGCVQRPGFNKLVYNGSLLKSLKSTALNQLERCADSEEAQKLSYEEIASATEISAFENAVIAPLFGFQDNIDYYRKTDCVQFLDSIRVPTLVINAKDDPFFDPDSFPFDKGCTSPVGRKKRSPVRLVRTDYGGHLGYMFHQREKVETTEDEVSYLPSELSRFLQHVWERRSSLDKR
jgi:uncharacterized protein